MEESKRERFVRLIESRMNNALKQIELISNLSNTRAYEYTDEDIDLIVKTLKSAINDLEHSFKKNNKKTRFELKK